MNKRKKIKLLELIILSTIFVSLIVIIFASTILLHEDIKESDTNKIKNYSLTKITKYETPSTESTKYNLPNPDYINYEQSTFYNYIESTDNLIYSITEVITISYFEYPSELRDNIINYCNAYDEIENSYTLQCYFKNNKITLKNSFSLNKIYSDTLQTKNYELYIPIKNETRLNLFLETLSAENIQYTTVEKIE